jgi:serine O-acetyltransferase
MKKNLADRGFLVKNYQANAQSLPINRGQAVAWLSDLLELLFPAFQTAKPPTPQEAEKMVARLDRELHMILTALIPAASVEVTADGFFSALEDLYDQLMLDARALEQGDPAAESLEEVLIAYPGFLAITVYRLAHRFWELHVPILPRVLTEWAHAKTGIDIHPGAQLGHPVVIDHGTGIVIGESTIIGNHVKLYQGVTLGALSVDKSLAATKRHPTIEDEVTIYANATILGGETVIGHGSVIGGNTWITSSIPPNSLVFHQSEIHIRIAPEAESPDFVI